MLGGPRSCERMAIECIWLFLEESTTDWRERGGNGAKTVSYDKPTAIFTANFSKIVMAPSYGMAIFGRCRCCQVELAGKLILSS